MEAQPFLERGIRREHRAAEHIAVPAKEFRRAVDDEVGPEVERALQHWAREGAVHCEQRVALRA